MSRVVFVFLDGVGLGLPNESNPFWSAQTPSIRQALGAPLVSGSEQSRPDLSLLSLDAQLDVEGVPQSATGQVSLFTGVNAAKMLGFHLPAFPNGPLRELVRTRSVLRQAVDLGHRVTFANAYSVQYFEMVAETNRPMSATTHAVLGAEIPLRWMSDLKNRRAVYWDITNEHLIDQHGLDIPIISPEEAGRNLANLSTNHDLVLYESFLTDMAGHKKNREQALRVIERLDGFIGSLWANVSADTTTVICSDHGNIEDLSRGIHTLNPVPLLVKGPGVPAFWQARSITDLVKPILHILQNTQTNLP